MLSVRMLAVISTLIGCRVRNCSANECEVGFYKDEDNICRRCLPDCVSCANNITCAVCKPNYYGPDCTHSCLDHCYGGECTRDGCTRGCQDGYFFVNSNNTCMVCDPICETCSSYSQCIVTCEPEETRNETDQCPGCLFPCAQCVANSTECTQCQRGHYLSNGTCNSCDTGCQICHGEHTCTACHNGFFLSNQSCEQCPSNCSSCFSDTNCTECLDGYYIDQISQMCRACPSECESCESELFCSVCTRYHYGRVCEHRCSGNCIEEPNSTVCNQHNGTCTIGCASNSWGHFCNRSCSDGCLMELCSREQGECFRCETDKYGYLCDKKCSSSCRKPRNNSNVCRQHDGVCVFGCVEGTSCPTDTPVSSSQVDDDSSNGHLGTVIGAVAGSVAGIIVGCVVAFLIMRRRYRPESDTNCWPWSIKNNTGSLGEVCDSVEHGHNGRGNTTGHLENPQKHIRHGWKHDVSRNDLTADAIELKSNAEANGPEQTNFRGNVTAEAPPSELYEDVDCGTGVQGYVISRQPILQHIYKQNQGDPQMKRPSHVHNLGENDDVVKGTESKNEAGLNGTQQKDDVGRDDRYVNTKDLNDDANIKRDEQSDGESGNVNVTNIAPLYENVATKRKEQTDDASRNDNVADVPPLSDIMTTKRKEQTDNANEHAQVTRLRPLSEEATIKRKGHKGNAGGNDNVTKVLPLYEDVPIKRIEQADKANEDDNVTKVPPLYEDVTIKSKEQTGTVNRNDNVTKVPPLYEDVTIKSKEQTGKVNRNDNITKVSPLYEDVTIKSKEQTDKANENYNVTIVPPLYEDVTIKGDEETGEVNGNDNVTKDRPPSEESTIKHNEQMNREKTPVKERTFRFTLR